jgi:hypothetical protein
VASSGPALATWGGYLILKTFPCLGCLLISILNPALLRRRDMIARRSAPATGAGDALPRVLGPRQSTTPYNSASGRRRPSVRVKAQALLHARESPPRRAGNRASGENSHGGDARKLLHVACFTVKARNCTNGRTGRASRSARAAAARVLSRWPTALARWSGGEARAICCRSFTPAQLEYPAASVRDYCSGAYTGRGRVRSTLTTGHRHRSAVRVVPIRL